MERVPRAWRVWLQLSVPRSLLLSLCEQGVSVHRLPAFQLTCQATNIRCAPIAALALAAGPLPSGPLSRQVPLNPAPRAYPLPRRALLHSLDPVHLFDRF